jgi:hypothetical protein
MGRFQVVVYTDSLEDALQLQEHCETQGYDYEHPEFVETEDDSE